MADDNTARFRSSDPYGRSTGSSAPANDPLAELARLIGQNDPFAEFGQGGRQQDNRQPPQPDSGPRYGNYPNYDPLPPQPAPEPYAQEPAPYSQDSYSQPPYNQAPAYEPEPRFPVDLPPLPRFSAPQPQHDDWPGSPTPAPSYQPRDPFPPQHLPPQHLPPVPGFDQPAYADRGSHQNYQDQHQGQGYPQDFQPERPSFDPPPSFLTADRPPPFMQPSFAEAPAPVYPAAPEAGAMPAPHDDEFYDDAPRPRRRKGLLTVAAVLALAVVGTASAVGYRSFFGGPGKSSPPPVIRASAEPNKVAPPQSNATDPSAGKFNYDRFADRSKDEQVVKREETPIDPRDLARSGAPRVVAPGAPVANSPSSRTGTTATATAPSAIGEPRRVRTVPIKPDASDMGSNIPSGSADQLPPPPPSRQASAPPATRPADPPARAAAPQPRSEPRSESRTAAASRNTPAPSANAPLSLSPEASNSQLSVPPPAAVRDLPAPGQISAPQPQRQANAAPAAAPAPRASAGGRFHVQVASQKSEADAQASYRSIQSRYSGVLGGQPHVVRRADLGAKGTYYRALVGPFGSRDEAVRLCSSLKSAGGDCVVQAN
jgi:sporulation related protein